MSRTKKNKKIERKVEVICIPCPDPSILEIVSNKSYFDKKEFSSIQLSKPNDQFNVKQPNNFFLHTYNWKPKHRCCQVLKAHIKMKMTSLTAASSLSSPNAGNDIVSIVKNGGISIAGEKVFSSSNFPISKGEVVTKSFVLSGSQLDWLNSAHKLSIFVQDDTSVNWIKLRLEICCLKKVKRCKGKL